MKNKALAVLAALVLLVVLLMLPTGFEGNLTYQNADRVRAEVLATDESDIVDTGLIRTGADHIPVCPLTQNGADSIDHDGFTGAGLAGKHIETGMKRNIGTLNNRNVFNMQ